jgi:hypothetical protein
MNDFYPFSFFMIPGIFHQLIIIAHRMLDESEERDEEMGAVTRNTENLQDFKTQTNFKRIAHDVIRLLSSCCSFLHLVNLFV